MASNKKSVKKTAPVQVEETPPPPVEVILPPPPPIDDDEEERLLMEQLKATRARKAQREATAQILPLRQARAGELLHKHEEIKKRIFDLEIQAGEIFERN